MNEKIISGALELYLKYGIKSITMDDVAKELGVSKKTIYQVVQDKADLVQKATEFFISIDKQNMANLVGQFDNIMEQMVQIGNYGCNVLKNLNPSVIYDLKKYYPATWQHFLEYKNTFFYEIIFDNIKSGIKAGLYRDNLNVDIISRFYIGQIEVIVDDNIFPPVKYRFEDLCKEFIKYHIHGIATPTGIELCDKFIAELDRVKTDV